MALLEPTSGPNGQLPSLFGARTPPWPLRAIAFGALILAACGGGGGGTGGGGGSGSGPGGGVSPAPLPVATDYLVAGLSQGTAGFVLHLSDPASTSPVSLFRYPNRTGYGGVPSWAISEQGRLRVGPTTTAFFIDPQGRVQHLDLHRDAPVRLQQRSNVTDACAMLGTIPIDTRGSDAYALVQRAGADGVCGTADDFGPVPVRSSTTAADAPPVLPSGLRPQLGVLPLWSDGGNLHRVLSLRDEPDGVRLVTLDASLAVREAVGGLGVTSSFRTLAGDPSGGKAMYVVTDGALRRLTWTDNNVTAGAPQWQFSAAVGLPGGVVDSSGLYVLDGETLVHASGTAPATARARIAGQVMAMHLVDEHVLLVRWRGADAVPAYELLAVPKAGGEPAVIATAAALDGMAVIGVQGNTIHVAVGTGRHRWLSWSASAGLATVADDVVVIAPVYSPLFETGSLYNPAASGGQTRTDAVLYCRPVAGVARGCFGGTVLQRDLTTGSDMVLGTLPGLGAAATATTVLHLPRAENGQLYSGLPGPVWESFTAVSGDIVVTGVDTHLWQPARPALTRISTLPR